MVVIPRRALLALLLSSLSTVALACSDDASSSSSSSSSTSGSSGSAVTLPDACSLISAAEVESLLGAPTAGEPESSTSAGGDLHRCTWKRKYSPELRTDELVLTIAQAAAYSATGPSALTGAVPFAIGDEGQVLDQTRGVQAAWKKGALSASYRYSVSGLFTSDFEPLRTRSKELAQAANGRM